LNGGKVVSLVRFHGYEGKNTEVYFNVWLILSDLVFSDSLF
jgi:hypothetical protein